MVQFSSLVWVCLREEPVVYIHGRPYVLRNLIDVFKNMDDWYGADVDSLEERLKKDILNEAKKYNSMFLVHKEIVLFSFNY